MAIGTRACTRSETALGRPRPIRLVPFFFPVMCRNALGWRARTAQRRRTQVLAKTRMAPQPWAKAPAPGEGLVFISERQDSRIVQRACGLSALPRVHPRVRWQPRLGRSASMAVWRNSGTTPATNVHGLIGATFVANERDFQFGVADSGGQVSLSVAGFTFGESFRVAITDFEPESADTHRGICH